MKCRNLCALLTLLCPFVAVGHLLTGEAALAVGFAALFAVGVMTTAFVHSASLPPAPVPPKPVLCGCPPGRCAEGHDGPPAVRAERVLTSAGTDFNPPVVAFVQESA